MGPWQDCDDENWQALLAELPHDFYDLIDYVKLDAALEDGQPLALATRLERGHVLLPLVLCPIPAELSGNRKCFDARSPYGYPGILYPSDTPTDFLDSALRSFREVGMARGIVATFLRLHPIFNGALCSLERSDGIEIVPCGSTVSTDLSLPSAELESQTRGNHRRNIRRLSKAGFSVRFDDWSDYAEFQRLYRQTMERRRAGRRYFFDADYFTELTRLLGSRLSLCSVVSPEGDLAAAGLFVRTDGLVQYHLGATSAAYLRLAPSKLMFYAAIRWFREAGASRLHLGGGLGAARDSLFEFKRGFGTDVHSFAVAHIIHDRSAYEQLVERRAERENGRKPLAGFFPEYRAI